MIPERPGTSFDGSPEEPQPRRRGAFLWILAAGPLLLGLLLFGAAGVVLFVPGLLGAQAQTDDSGLAPIIEDPPEDPVTDAVAAVDSDTDEAVVTPVAPVDVVRPPPTHQGTADDPPVVPPVQPPKDPDEGTAEDTDAAPATVTDPVTDPVTVSGTSDAPDVTVSETPIEQCVTVTAPPPPRVGTPAQFQANVCDRRPGTAVTLWYRPAGASSWQSVRMPFRIGAFRAVVNVDERFSGGLEYYVETDGATFGGRSSPKRLRVD